MVSRRAYIAAILGVGAVSGYTITRSPDSREDAPLSDNSTIITKSGETPTNTDEFEIKSPFSTIAETSATGIDEYSVRLLNIATNREYVLVEGEGTNTRKRILDLPTSYYRIHVTGDITNWETKLTSQQQMPDDTAFSENLPLKTSGDGYSITQPISLVPQRETTINFSIENPTTNTQRVIATNEYGESRAELLSIKNESTTEKTITDTLSGRGFVIIDANTQWNLELYPYNNTDI